jgi:phosphoglycerol geranylgeranyltransferase
MEKHFGKVYRFILEQIDEKKGLTFLVIDPPNQSPDVAGKIAEAAERAGVAAITVGGSVGAQGKLLDDTIVHIKEACSLPVILFPGNIATLSEKADALYFMSMLNSLDPYYITGAQISAALPVKEMGVEAIPTSYIIIEPGRAAGWVGRAHLIPREHPYLAAITALAGQMMGAHLIILESGGGAPRPAPLDMIAMTRRMVEVPIIVAGGVKNPEHANAVIKAGADIIHVGTAIEHTSSDARKAKQKLEAIVKAAKEGGRARTRTGK